jgi:hypothetical protein
MHADASLLSPRAGGRARRSSFEFAAALGEALEATTAAAAATTTSGASPAAAAAAPPPPPLPPLQAAAAYYHPPPPPTVAAEDVRTAALGAHPFRPLLLAGSSSGEVLLFQFGRRTALAAYTPLLPGEGAGGSPGADGDSLFGAPPAAWGAHPGGASAAAAWGQPQAARFSRCGERAAGVGSAGGVAVWRLDAPRSAGSGTGGLGRADWARGALSRRGVALAWVGASASLLAVAGSDAHADVQLWDTRAPAPAHGGPTAAAAPGGGPMATALAALPGGRSLAVGDEGGGLRVLDLRLLGGGLGGGGGPPASTAATAPGARALVWKDATAAGVTCADAASLPGYGSVLVAGGRDGVVRVWAPDDGAALQALDASAAAWGGGGSGGAPPAAPHPPPRRSFFGALAAPLRAPPPAVTGVALTADGLVAACLDGVVRAWAPADVVGVTSSSCPR